MYYLPGILKAKRLLHNFSQKDVSMIIFKKQNTYSAYEKGSHRATMEDLILLAKLYKVEPNELIIPSGVTVTFTKSDVDISTLDISPLDKENKKLIKMLVKENTDLKFEVSQKDLHIQKLYTLINSAV